MEDNEYYEDLTASREEFKPNYDQFGKGNAANELPPKKGPHADLPREQRETEGAMKVEHGYVINLPICNLLTRRVAELKECYIVLYDHFILYKVIGKLEVLDEATDTWVEEKVNFRWTRMRKDLTDVSMYYNNHEKLYCVEIEIGKNTQTWHWVKGADAKKFYDIMQNYFVTRDQK